jgi:hypothetical protein
LSYGAADAECEGVLTVRLIYGFCAFLLWGRFLGKCMENGDVLSDEVIAYSLAIITAGAMMGRD